MLGNARICLHRSLWIFRLTALVLLPPLLALASTASAQSSVDSSYYARRNSFGVFGSYSGDSSHILLGDAENRKLLNIGVSYSRRLFLNNAVNWQFDAELMPVALESDPLSHFVDQETSPTPVTRTYDGQSPLVTCAPVEVSYSYTTPNGVTYSGTTTTTCRGRRWTPGQAMSPAGMQWNFRPRHKLQPIVAAHGGYMYSTKNVPLDYAGAFNFTFDLGVGIELFRTRSRSIRAEYRYHHISNDDTASANPGIDSGLFQVSYVFGR